MVLAFFVVEGGVVVVASTRWIVKNQRGGLKNTKVCSLRIMWRVTKGDQEARGNKDEVRTSVYNMHFGCCNPDTLLYRNVTLYSY